MPFFWFLELIVVFTGRKKKTKRKMKLFFFVFFISVLLFLSCGIELLNWISYITVICVYIDKLIICWPTWAIVRKKSKQWKLGKWINTYLILTFTIIFYLCLFDIPKQKFCIINPDNDFDLSPFEYLFIFFLQIRRRDDGYDFCLFIPF